MQKKYRYFLTIITLLTANYMNGKITYRQATHNDIPQLAQMRWEYLTESTTTSTTPHTTFINLCTTFLSNGFTSGNLTCWLAEDDDKIIAHALIQLVPNMPRLNYPVSFFGYIYNVYAIPTYRNKKIGQTLMEYVLAWVRKNPQITALILWSNGGAIPFYERLGFTRQQTDCQLMEYDCKRNI